VLVTSPLIDVHDYELIRRVVREQRLPTISNYEDLAWSDVLMAYGPNPRSAFQRAAQYARRILEGAKPSDLPVERPTQFDLVLNLKSAKALGLTFPDSVLIRATAVLK
jgi:putative ABC transport system substrate-binding protein